MDSLELGARSREENRNRSIAAILLPYPISTERHGQYVFHSQRSFLQQSAVVGPEIGEHRIIEPGQAFETGHGGKGSMVNRFGTTKQIGKLEPFAQKGRDVQVILEFHAIHQSRKFACPPSPA
jgi:hypothetical protein